MTKIKKEQSIDFLLVVNLKFENNKKINASDVLAEWDPFTFTYCCSNRWTYSF